jgi:hypothetical protein
MPRPSVSRFGNQDDRPVHGGERLAHAAHEQRREDAREKAAGTDDDRRRTPTRIGNRRMDRRRRLEPEAAAPGDRGSAAASTPDLSARVTVPSLYSAQTVAGVRR